MFEPVPHRTRAKPWLKIPRVRKDRSSSFDEPAELPVAGFGPFEEGLEVALKDPIEHRGLGVPRTVERRAR